MRLPGLIDVHVHLRVPGATHKEDLDTGTAAALAGGHTMVLAMPNTDPPLDTQEHFEIAAAAGAEQARCDFGHYAVGTSRNAETVHTIAPRAAGLKLYLDHTYGELELHSLEVWMDHVRNWPEPWPLAAHAEQRSVPSLLLFAQFFDRPVHICHVSRREEILIIAEAKQRGLPVTCEVAAHHLFLTIEDIDRIGEGRSQVRPPLATPADRDALWEHLDIIDCFATDHAPHLLAEKDSDSPPPGFPGLETALPLLLGAVHEGRLEVDDIVRRMHTRPREIFGLPEQPETWIEVDEEARWEVPTQGFESRSNWSPFAGMPVRGRVERVVLRGEVAYEGGSVLAQPGSGRDVRQ